MRNILIGAALVCSVVASNSSAQAQTTWPWCAVLTLQDSLSTNCGFANRRQCEQTLEGIGGWCEPNPRYWAETPRRFDRPRYYNR